MTENVANNVAQGNSQDLTEKWRYGKLKNGFYYIKDINDRVTTILYRQDHISVIKEVLAPVPSYDNWVYLHKARNDAHEIVESLTQENQQLKTLLKEWMHFYPIILYEHEDTLKTRDIIELYDKTANAIGEKK